MANKIQPETLETLNQIARYIHFDPGAKKGILTKEQLSIRTGIGYNKLTRIMNDSKFAVIFDENVLGSITLSGEVPAFLEEFVDLETPYVPVFTCNDPSHTDNSVSQRQTPQKRQGNPPKMFHTQYYSADTIKSLLSEEGQKTFGALLDLPNPVKPGNDQTHIWWQFQNMVNYIQTALLLVKSENPAEKAKELIDDPDKFPALKKILGTQKADHITDTPEAIMAEPDIIQLGGDTVNWRGHEVARDIIKKTLDQCYGKPKDGTVKIGQHTLTYGELEKEMKELLQ